MINLSDLLCDLGNTDIYLLDQIMKNLYSTDQRILDAGCGEGRNSHLLLRLGMEVYGVDNSKQSIDRCHENFPDAADRFYVGDLLNMPFESNYFDHLISSAVLHFSESKQHFHQLFSEHMRVLKPGGSIFIRMTTKYGLSSKSAVHLGKGIYQLKDQTTRFLMDHHLLATIMKMYSLELLEEIKTVNVNNKRAMGVIVLQKTTKLWNQR